MKLPNIFKIREDNSSNTEIEYASLRKRLDAVVEINGALVGIIDKDKVFSLITSKLVSVLGVSFASIWLWQEDEQVLTLQSVNAPQTAIKFAENILGISLNKVKFDAKDPKAKDNLTLKSLLTNTVLETNDYYDIGHPYSDRRMSKAFQLFLGMKRAINIPLVIGNERLGALSIIWKKDVVTDADRMMINVFANLISIAVYNSLLFERVQYQVSQLETQNKDLGSLFNLSTQISKSLDPKQVAQNAVDSLPQNDFMLGGLVLNYSQEEAKLWVTAITQNPITTQIQKIIGELANYKTDINDPKAELSPAVMSIKNDALAYTDDLNAVLYPFPKRIANLVAKLINIKSIVSYPLKSRGKTIGVVEYFLKDRSYSELDENKKQLLNTYTLQISIAFENAMLYAESQATRQHLEDALYQLKEVRRQERDMIDVMGHELRTPISIVRNALVMVERQMAKQTEINRTDLHKYMDMALESTRREITLIETLLSATKVDAARMQLFFTKVGFKDVINDGIEGQKTQLSKKPGVEIIYTPPADDVVVYADRTRMQEIMDNLLSNAVKYTLQGKITIQTWKDENMGWISIKDEGIGISPEDLVNLGKKFFRAKQYVNDGGEVEDTEIVRPGGTGLGLYVTYDLVRIMGGTLYINSEVGKGSTFSVSLPLQKAQPDKQIDETFDLDDKGKKTHIVINKPILGPQ